MSLEGLSPYQPIVSNERGGKQSLNPYSFTLLPPLAVAEVAKVMAEGASRYDRDNWRKIGVEDHINRVLGHCFAYLAGDESDDHLGHAAARMLMALELDIIGYTDDEE